MLGIVLTEVGYCGSAASDLSKPSQLSGDGPHLTLWNIRDISHQAHAARGMGWSLNSVSKTHLKCTGDSLQGQTMLLLLTGSNRLSTEDRAVICHRQSAHQPWASPVGQDAAVLDGQLPNCTLYRKGNKEVAKNEGTNRTCAEKTGHQDRCLGCMLMPSLDSEQDQTLHF